jgi:hypothetical protein
VWQRIGPELAEPLKPEARRRAACGRSFGFVELKFGWHDSNKHALATAAPTYCSVSSDGAVCVHAERFVEIIIYMPRLREASPRRSGWRRRPV